MDKSKLTEMFSNADPLIFEKNFTIEDVHGADEVFVTGTFAGIIPVVSIDNIQISNGTKGRLTSTLQEYYKKHLGA